MFRKHVLRFVSIVSLTYLLTNSWAVCSAREYCGGRGLFGGRSGTGHGFGLFKKDPPSPYPQPKRYYDTTGRWLGDGVDTMSTAPNDRVPGAPTWTFHPN